MLGASVVVCTRNRAARLEQCLARLDDQLPWSGSADPDDLRADDRRPDGPGPADGFEIVVVDNGSTDGTGDLLARWRAVDPERRIVVGEPVAGLSRARNRGVAAARGDIVLFIDDDAVAPRGWVTAHRAAHAAPHASWGPGAGRDRGGNGRAPDGEPVRSPGDQVDGGGLPAGEVVAVGGPVALAWPEGRPAWLAPRLDHWFSALDLGDDPILWPTPHGPYGTNMSVRRSVIEAVGGFDERLGRRGRSLVSGEEGDLFSRVWDAGGAVAYAPAALVLHEVTRDRLSRRWVLRRGWAQGRTNARRLGRGGPDSARALATVCRVEAGTAVRDIGGVMRTAAAGGRSSFLDEVARRSGHLATAVELAQMRVRDVAPRRGGRRRSSPPADRVHGHGVGG